MRSALALALGLAATLLACQCNAAVPVFPTMPQNWYSPQYVGVEIVQGTDIALKGSMVWQMDANFSRSAFTSSTGGYSNFMDWDGKTYGSGSGPAIYWFIEGYQCEWWCPLDLTDMCNEAESFCQYDLLHNATYANSTTIGGVPVDLFAWDDYLVIEDMAQNALFMVHNAPVPVQRWQRLTPFGKYVGNITQSYGGFSAGLPASDAWTKVIGADYCQQGSESQCPSSQRARRQLLASLQQK